MMIEWIKTEEELPPCDGIYEVTNHPEIEEDPIIRHVTSTANYDGWGFQYLGVYRNPGYWRKIPERKQKIYGKIK